MRELKLRAWSNEHNRYCDFVTLDENGRWIGWFKSSGVYLTTVDIVLEQYTGLKDKNGKEIYEGDIVRQEMFFGDNGDITIIGQVSYIGKEAGFFVSDGKRDDGYYFEGIYEVIGNIHENADLLKEEE